jgi:hypothetical protein
VFTHVRADSFVGDFNRRAFLLRHSLNDHPLLQMERLRALALELSPPQLELNRGDVPPDPSDLTNDHTRRGLQAVEALEHIDTCATWVGLKEIERVPEYCALLDQILDEVQPFVEAVEPGMHDRQGFVFVSSPHTVVPCHFDPEHGFLLQLRGRKRLTVFAQRDPRLLGEQELERHYTTGSRRLHLPASLECSTGVQTFELGPGDALHVPVSAPHYVRSLGEPTISLSVTFRTRPGERRARLYRMNHALRHLGLEPRAVGASAAVDAARYSVYLAARALARLNPLAPLSRPGDRP